MPAETPKPSRRLRMSPTPTHSDWEETWIFADVPFKTWFDDEVDRWKLLPYPGLGGLDDRSPEIEDENDNKLWVERCGWLQDRGLWKRTFASRIDAAVALAAAVQAAPLPNAAP